MSLHAAAQHLSSKGRGPDETLVHMSHDEVRGLNNLAMAHGGQLTINPDTGLPEAGFLSKLLPMIGGAALAMIPGVGPMMAAGIMGGGTALATGSLKKGLMAGLSAYGGAGLGSSLMNAGAAAGTTAGAAGATEAAAAANPLAGLDMSGVTTAGESIGGNAISSAAPEAFATPVAGANPMISNALPAQGAFNPTQVTSMPGTNYAPSVNPTDAMSRLPSQESLANQVREGAQNMSNAGSAVPTVEPDMSQYTRGMSATPASAAASQPPTFSDNMANMQRGFTGENLMSWAKENPLSAAGMAASLIPDPKAREGYKGDADMGQRYSYSANRADPTPTADPSGREQRYFTPTYTKISNEEAKNIYGFAGGGPVEMMSDANSIGANTGYPMADISKGAYATPYQTPISRNVISDAGDTGVNPMTGEMANFARGGLSSAASHLGDYSDGGRLLRGPGDGVSDSIPAMIGKKQPARLADGEFVVPARIVSELGNGSTEAGARKLYAMLDRVQAARKKSIGKGKVAKNSRADKLLPA
jgi:hypothetical protein